MSPGSVVQKPFVSELVAGECGLAGTQTCLRKLRQRAPPWNGQAAGFSMGSTDGSAWGRDCMMLVSWGMSKSCSRHSGQHRGCSPPPPPTEAVPRPSSCSGLVLQGGGRKGHPLSVGWLDAGPRARRTELPADTPFPGSSPREGQRERRVKRGLYLPGPSPAPFHRHHQGSLQSSASWRPTGARGTTTNHVEWIENLKPRARLYLFTWAWKNLNGQRWKGLVNNKPKVALKLTSKTVFKGNTSFPSFPPKGSTYKKKDSGLPWWLSG